MKKNYKLVIWITTEQKEKLERQAKEENMKFVAELCRRKLLKDITINYN